MRKKFVLLIAGVVGVMGFVNAAHATMTSGAWFLDQSNTFADGVNYGRVDIAADDALGTVMFTVDVFDVGSQTSFYANFGIQAFGFNTQNLTDAPGAWTVVLPTGWTQNNGGGNLDGFGDFVVTEDGLGNSRQDPLVFTITLPTLADAIASNFALLSTNNTGQGNAFFAAHVAGFYSGVFDTTEILESHFIGGSTVVPAPAAAVLALIGLGVSRHLRRRRSA